MIKVIFNLGLISSKIYGNRCIQFIETNYVFMKLFIGISYGLFGAILMGIFDKFSAMK